MCAYVDVCAGGVNGWTCIKYVVHVVHTSYAHTHTHTHMQETANIIQSTHSDVISLLFPSPPSPPSPLATHPGGFYEFHDYFSSLCHGHFSKDVTHDPIGHTIKELDALINSKCVLGWSGSVCVDTEFTKLGQLIRGE